MNERLEDIFSDVMTDELRQEIEREYTLSQQIGRAIRTNEKTTAPCPCCGVTLDVMHGEDGGIAVCSSNPMIIREEID